MKDGSPAESGNVIAGTTVITYVYKLATGGNVFEKYMLEGTTTEIAEGKVLKQDASIGDEYTSVAPKVGTLLQKDGKTYFYKGHRATSAPEIGTVDENEKTVIYDFVEYFSEKGEPAKQENLPMYTELIEDRAKPRNQEQIHLNPIKIDEPTKQEGSHQDEAVAQEEDKSSYGKHSESGEELPQTGQAELPNTGTEANASLAALGLLGVLTGFGFLARKKKED